MSQDSRPLEMERRKALHGLERWLEMPMLFLAFIWLVLLIIELIWGLGPVLEGLGTLIWIIFVLDAGVRLLLAPNKAAYFKNNWLTVIALALPALRVFRAARVVRVLRMARATRGLRLVLVVSSLNRGMHALGASMRRRGFAYVATLTLLVTLTGAAGMYVFERDIPGQEPVSAGSGRAGENGQEPVSAGSGHGKGGVSAHLGRAGEITGENGQESVSAGSGHGNEARPGALGSREGAIAGLNDYGAALWWTAMIMTMMGSDYWPHTAEGRVLCLLLALYAFAMFGYVTATLASYFVGRDAQNDQAEIAGAHSIDMLRKEVESLRADLRGLMQKQNPVS